MPLTNPNSRDSLTAEVSTTAILKIMRSSGRADRFRAYKIILDGKEVGEIGEEETKEFPTTSGQHEISLKIDWCGSNVVRFTASDGQVSMFDAKNNIRSFNRYRMLWQLFFARNTYLLLEPR